MISREALPVAGQSLASRTKPAFWILTAATLYAAVMRFMRLESLAPAAWFDEVWFALRARELLQTGALHVFYPTEFGGANAGLVYLTALVQMLGLDTITSARWVIAVSGVIAVPLAYQCFKELTVSSFQFPAASKGSIHHELVGVLSAIFLAYTLFFVIITRVGMESGIAPAVAMFVVWQMRRLKRSGWTLAGLALGLSQYNGLHARFILPIALYVMVDMLIIAGIRRGRNARGILILLLAAFIVTAPLIGYFVQYPEWLTARAGIVAGGGADRYWHNFTQIARVFSLEGSYDPKTTVPGVPLLDAIQSIGFYAGLVWCALNVHRHQAARVLIVWLIVSILPGVLTDGPNLQRMINLAAPLAGITAIGWTWLYNALLKTFPQKPSAPLRRNKVSTFAGSVLSLLLLTSALWHTYHLFNRWPQEPKLGAQFSAPPVTLARSAIAASAHQPIFAERAPEAEDVIAWSFLFPDTPVTRLDLRQCLPLPHQRSTPTGYLVLTSRDTQTLDLLRAWYPQSYFRAREIDLGIGGERASWLEIPANVEAPMPQVRAAAHFEGGLRLLGFDAPTLTLKAGETLNLTLYWHTTEAMTADFTTFTHIGIEGAPPLAQRDGQPCSGLYPTSQWQAGEVIRDAFAISIPADAPAGEYDLVAGWYAYPSFARLALVDAESPLPDQRARIGTVRVEAP